MLPGLNPIGKRFACCEAGPKGRMDPVWHEVVGVVADVHAWGLDREVQPEFYIPFAQMPPGAWDWIGRAMDLVVRTHAGVIPIHELQKHSRVRSGRGANLPALDHFGTRLLSSLLYGVRPTHAATLALVSLILLAVALIASYLPARRATRAHPLR